ncbi:hypothetical protein BDC45DRAFT_209117 [Circinella umbellata]|nr:hypothetical protein BDC45DRAFT_209117 [Circinella umbellata]
MNMASRKNSTQLSIQMQPLLKLPPVICNVYSTIILSVLLINISDLIIFIVNQLFISNNDVIESDWLEREFFFGTDRVKWDGMLIKVENRSCSIGLIEFSGGGLQRPNFK